MSAITESPAVEVRSEPLTYERGRQAVDGVSYMRDLMFRESDAGAAFRLERHAREMDLEMRTNPGRVQGSGGYAAPPLWLIDQFATAPRPNRVLAKRIDKAGNLFPLPPGVQSINLPRLTTGTVEQPVGDLASTPTGDIVDAASSSPVVAITGDSDVSMQLLEQSPAGPHLDVMLFRDLSEAYDAQLETMLLTGTGPVAQPTSQFVGLLALPGANGVAYTSATPSATGLFPLLGSVMAQAGKARKRPPELWLMSTSRMGWLGSSEDAQNRPLMIANNSRNGSFDLLAVDVGVTDAIPANLSGSPVAGNTPPVSVGPGAQDAIIACIPSDMLLWESQPRMSVMLEVLSGVLMARLQFRAYCAFICRYPMGVSILSGTGLTVQPGF